MTGGTRRPPGSRNPGRGKSGAAGGRLGAGSRAEPGPVPDYASRVLDVADSIPPGRVMSYGDVAEYLGQGGPRQVGRVMALWGGSVPWWRVVHADGSLLRGHERAALERYRAEGTPLRPSPDGPPSRVNMRLARWSGEGT